MKYTEIQKYLEKLKVFSVADLKNIDENYNKSKLFNWKKSGYIKQIIQGFYLYGNIEIHQNMLFVISNKIYSPSYISLESAFNYYGIIPEYVFTITGVATKKSVDFQSDIGYFSYRKIKSNLFWGYKIVKMNDVKYLIAEPEKAILDYLYLNTKINSIEDFEGLRLNKEILNERIDFEKLQKYTTMFTNKALEKRIEIFINYIQLG